MQTKNKQKGGAAKCFGVWKDDRMPEKIIQYIKSARVNSKDSYDFDAVIDQVLQ